MNSKNVLYREKLRELLEISQAKSDSTYFEEEVAEALIDHVLDGKLMVGIKDSKVVFTATRK